MARKKRNPPVIDIAGMFDHIVLAPAIGGSCPHCGAKRVAVGQTGFESRFGPMVVECSAHCAKWESTIRGHIRNGIRF